MPTECCSKKLHLLVNCSDRIAWSNPIAERHHDPFLRQGRRVSVTYVRKNSQLLNGSVKISTYHKRSKEEVHNLKFPYLLPVSRFHVPIIKFQVVEIK